MSDVLAAVYELIWKCLARRFVALYWKTGHSCIGKVPALFLGYYRCILFPPHLPPVIGGHIPYLRSSIYVSAQELVLSNLEALGSHY